MSLTELKEKSQKLYTEVRDMTLELKEKSQKLYTEVRDMTLELEKHK